MIDCDCTGSLMTGIGIGALLGCVFLLGSMWLCYFVALRCGVFPAREDSSEPLWQPKIVKGERRP
jgi:hypothetical protein